jgi:hypothetical protein
LNFIGYFFFFQFGIGSKKLPPENSGGSKQEEKHKQAIAARLISG